MRYYNMYVFVVAELFSLKCYYITVYNIIGLHEFRRPSLFPAAVHSPFTPPLVLAEIYYFHDNNDDDDDDAGDCVYLSNFPCDAVC